MKTIGLIGGLGPESTVDYYKAIIGAFNARYPERAYPEIIVYSTDLKRLLGMVAAEAWPALSARLLEIVSALQRAGAEFAAIASNTPHIVFDELRRSSPLPLLSIVEETCRRAREMGLKRVGLMGTRLTMGADFYKRPFVSNGMTVVVPSEAEQRTLQERLFSEIELGLFKDSTRDELLAMAKRMVDEDGIDSLVLGCTELPLILTESRWGIPFLNTSAIHCESIVRRCLE